MDAIDGHLQKVESSGMALILIVAIHECLQSNVQQAVSNLIDLGVAVDIQSQSDQLLKTIESNLGLNQPLIISDKAAYLCTEITSLNEMKKAYVSFSYASSPMAVKSAADIILCDDDFSSVYTACLGAKQFKTTILKFLIFQLIQNGTAMAFCSIGSLIFKVSPLTGVQLLYSNFVISILAIVSFVVSKEGESRIETKYLYGQVIW